LSNVFGSNRSGVPIASIKAVNIGIAVGKVANAIVPA
jgi:hypothetical protein